MSKVLARGMSKEGDATLAANLSALITRFSKVVGLWLVISIFMLVTQLELFLYDGNLSGGFGMRREEESTL